MAPKKDTCPPKTLKKKERKNIIENFYSLLLTYGLRLTICDGGAEGELHVDGGLSGVGEADLLVVPLQLQVHAITRVRRHLIVVLVKTLQSQQQWIRFIGGSLDSVYTASNINALYQIAAYSGLLL